MISADPVLVMTNTLVTGNQSAFGAGVYASNQFTITNCTISHNAAVQSGGGVFISSSGVGAVDNSVLWANTDADGSDLVAHQVLNHRQLRGSCQRGRPHSRCDGNDH